MHSFLILYFSVSLFIDHAHWHVTELFNPAKLLFFVNIYKSYANPFSELLRKIIIGRKTPYSLSVPSICFLWELADM